MTDNPIDTADYHTETIKCPDCGKIEEAKVFHLHPWNSMVHECSGCEYIIMESEWEKV